MRAAKTALVANTRLDRVVTFSAQWTSSPTLRGRDGLHEIDLLRFLLLLGRGFKWCPFYVILPWNDDFLWIVCAILEAIELISNFYSMAQYLSEDLVFSF
jgi:hypothetical protein